MPEDVAAHLAPLPEGERSRYAIALLKDRFAQEDEAKKNDAAIALLKSYLMEEATDDPELIREAERELGEFKRNLNANRTATGDSILSRRRSASCQ